MSRRWVIGGIGAAAALLAATIPVVADEPTIEEQIAALEERFYPGGVVPDDPEVLRELIAEYEREFGKLGSPAPPGDPGDASELSDLSVIEVGFFIDGCEEVPGYDITNCWKGKVESDTYASVMAGRSEERSEEGSISESPRQGGVAVFLFGESSAPLPPSLPPFDPVSLESVERRGGTLAYMSPPVSDSGPYWFPGPDEASMLRIDSVEGSILLLSSTDGTQFLFDAQCAASANDGSERRGCGPARISTP